MSQPVAMVSQAFVDRFLKQQDAIGTILRMAQADESAALVIVGVVGDIRRPGLEPDPVPMLYLPLAQAPRETITFAVRGIGSEAELLADAEVAIKAVSRESPVYNTDTLAGSLASLTNAQTLLGRLFAGFGMTAILLACLGTFALLNQSVQDRLREIGIRAAFGARPRDITALIRRDATKLAVIGLAVGCLLAAALSRGLQSQLYEVGTLDPVTYLGVATVLLLAVLLASIVPSWRAARVDPATTLRGQ